MKNKIYCCHHSPLKERKQDIINYFNENDFELIFVQSFEFGVDLFDNQTPITNGELSLLLKHYLIYENLLFDVNISGYLIIEDDILIPQEVNIKNFLNSVIEESEKSNYDIVFFGGTHNMFVENPVPYKIVYDGYNSSRCTHGYYITKKCAELIVHNKIFNKPIDHALNFYINKYNLKCGWTHPHLLQKTVEGVYKSSLR